MHPEPAGAASALFDPTAAVHLFLSGPLSQWYPSLFSWQGTRYSCGEQWMMAEKARLCGDAAALAAILAESSPRALQKLGRSVRGFDQKAWDAHKFSIVLQGTRLKFSQHSDLAAHLLGTGVQHLAEANPKDCVWGIGMGEAHADARTPSKWRGENLLGRALMLVREEMRKSCAGSKGAST